MDYFMKLPRNKKEFVCFMLIISIISVNIIAPIIAFLEVGFSFEVWGNAYKSIPLIWLCVIALVLITYKPASLMTNKILKKEDSFNAHILVNIMCTVFMMSIVLSLVAPMIVDFSISWEPFEQFFSRWPRNFAVAFAIELLVAQPIARFCLLKYHQHKDSKANSLINSNDANNLNDENKTNEESKKINATTEENELKSEDNKKE